MSASREKKACVSISFLMQISFAKAVRSRCSITFAVASDKKKALNPKGERLLLYPGRTSNAAAIAASRTSAHWEVILKCYRWRAISSRERGSRVIYQGRCAFMAQRPICKVAIWGGTKRLPEHDDEGRRGLVSQVARHLLDACPPPPVPVAQTPCPKPMSATRTFSCS